MRRTTLVSLLIACVAMAVIAPTAMAKGGGTKRTISLKGSISFPNATGKATSKINGSERELQIEAEHIKALAGNTSTCSSTETSWQARWSTASGTSRLSATPKRSGRTQDQIRIHRARAHSRRHADRRRHLLVDTTSVRGEGHALTSPERM